jgi:hypothetical protein
MFLIFYRQLDKPNGRSDGPINTSVGVQWGIFIAFLLGALLAYAGWRIRAANVAEPPADDVAPPPSPGSPPRGGHRAGRGDRAARAERRAGRPRRRPDTGGPPRMEGQLSFDEAASSSPRPAVDVGTPSADPDATTIAWDEPPTRRGRRHEVFERPADPDEPSEFDPPRRRR